jgi:hypothetical protein
MEPTVSRLAAWSLCLRDLQTAWRRSTAWPRRQVGCQAALFLLFFPFSPFAGKSFDVVSVPRALGDEELGRVLGLLKPGGELRFPAGSASEGSLLLAGFVDTTGTSARKPEWAEGAAQQLQRPKKWTLDTDDLVEDDLKGAGGWGGAEHDLIDEHDLLKDIAQVEPGQQVLAPGGESECGPSKKACKNCVCGRAEAEASGAAVQKKLTLEEVGAVSVDGAGRSVVDTAKLKAAAGGCGSCSLGDAFRCPGCPSRGLPSYTIGERIVLDL